MLTRSPVPARSSNASPSTFHTFHYAPAAVGPSPHLSPRAPTTASSRRPSISSATAAMTSSPKPSSQKQPQKKQQQQERPPPPKEYVSVDAATQYSPMEPVNYTAPRQPHSPQSKTPSELPPTPGPQPMALTDEGGESSQQRDGRGPLPQEQPQIVRAAPPMSPNKRRNSQVIPSDSAVASSSSAADESAEANSKRARPDTPPPKVLPQRYEFCPVEDMVVLIANMLAELIETNDALALKSGHLTRFHSRTAPGISVLDYLHRLAKHATLTPPLLLSMVYYIDRLCALYPDFTINTLTVHRFLITAATVAAKGLSDSFWNNSTYARVGGVRVAELKLLELEFLYRVDWKIVPNPEVLVAYYRGLVERSPAYVLQGEEEKEDGVEAEDEEEDDDSEEVDDESNEGATTDGVSLTGQQDRNE